jgi:hypothetical protein
LGDCGSRIRDIQGEDGEKRPAIFKAKVKKRNQVEKASQSDEAEKNRSVGMGL